MTARLLVTAAFVASALVAFGLAVAADAIDRPNARGLPAAGAVLLANVAASNVLWWFVAGHGGFYFAIDLASAAVVAVLAWDNRRVWPLFLFASFAVACAIDYRFFAGSDTSRPARAIFDRALDVVTAAQIAIVAASSLRTVWRIRVA